MVSDDGPPDILRSRAKERSTTRWAVYGDGPSIMLDYIDEKTASTFSRYRLTSGDGRVGVEHVDFSDGDSGPYLG
jgi:hypothetical protein